MYASPVTKMTSQLSQPSASISARVRGRNSATPKRAAQNGRSSNRPTAGVCVIRRAVSTCRCRKVLKRGLHGDGPHDSLHGEKFATHSATFFSGNEHSVTCCLAKWGVLGTYVGYGSVGDRR